MRKLILVSIFVLIAFSSLSGQRRVLTLDAAEIDSELKFDTNDVPVSLNVREYTSQFGQPGGTVDLNFAPNVVYSPDSSKAFVAAPFSDRVLVFDPRTAEPIELLTVGKNPASVSLSPDGRTVAVVSVFIKENASGSGLPQDGAQVGSISLIDVETLQVRTIQLQEVFFSVASNAIFSADSQTAFVSSTGTDQILRIDVDQASELTPRLQMPGGTRPATLAMAPDFSFFTAVLIGNIRLDRVQVPDSIRMIDPTSFQEIAAIVPATGQGTDQLIHDFTVANTLAISSDGKYGLIADRQNTALVGTLPELFATDRAFLIDFETRQVTDILGVGGVASGSFATPDGRFVVISSLEFAIIDPVEKTVNRFAPPVSEFRPFTRPTFSPDGRRMYIASPISDRVVVLDLETSELKRLFEVGGTITRIGAGGAEVNLSSAPLDLTISPDGQRMIALNFNANTIDVVVPSDRFFLPRMISDENFFTGVAITNLSAEPAELIITGFTPGGLLFQDDPETEDVVEFVNPRTIVLPAGFQLAETVAELLEAPGDPVIFGWMDFDTDVQPVTSFFLTGDIDLKRLDGTVASAKTAKRLVVSEVRINDGFSTEVNLFNPNLAATTVTAELFRSDGTSAAAITLTVAQRSVRTEFLKDPLPDDPNVAGLFSNQSFEEFEDGYVVFSSPEGLIVNTRYFDEERMASVAGHDTAASDVVLFVPQVISFAGSETILSLVNPTEESILADLTLFRDDGAILAGPVPVELEAGQSLHSRVRDLFELIDPGHVIGAWIRIDADQVGLVGSSELRLFSGRAMTTVPLQTRLESTLVFSHVAEGLGVSTGLALLNPGSADAVATIQLFNAEGVLVRQKQMLLAAGQKDARLIGEHFEDFPGQLGGYIVVIADQPLVGLELFFANDLEYLSAVTAQFPSTLSF